jgi:RND family efflux transporter MFP subunit
MSRQISPSPADRTKPKAHGFAFFLFLLVFLAVAGWGIDQRIEAATALDRKTAEESIPEVSVLPAARGALSEAIVLPGTVQAWHEAPIYARTNGYLKNWATDIGARVKAGDLLAEIETPEIDAQLHQAEADLATAEANNALAQTTAKRWQSLLKTNAVAKQETEEKTADAAAKEALAASAQANLDRLRELENFKRVTAPFDGTITARNTDTGALINAGSGGAGQELFHIAETDKLRVYVQVPESYAQALTPDMTADLRFAEYPQRDFPATLTRSADALDPATRTLKIELEVDNEKGELMPGSYAEVHLKVPSAGDNIRLPVNALLFRAEGLRVAVVGADGKAQLRPITLGRDYGTEVEVTSGLETGESVIVNPPDSLLDGQKVRVVSSGEAPAKTDKGGKKP